ncbi:MAG: peptidoglycan-binding protein [Rhodospirillales bacterium]|nr:peptidoglycan-binding protein [Rhodospirillales bacterium]
MSDAKGGPGLDRAAVLRVFREIDSLLALRNRRGEKPPILRLFQARRTAAWKRSVQSSIVQALRDEARRQATTMEGADGLPASAERVFQKQVGIGHDSPDEDDRFRSAEKLSSSRAFKERYCEIYKLSNINENNYFLYSYSIEYSCDLKSFTCKNLSMSNVELRTFKNVEDLHAEALPILGRESLDSLKQADRDRIGSPRVGQSGVQPSTAAGPSESSVSTPGMDSRVAHDMPPGPEITRAKAPPARSPLDGPSPRETVAPESGDEQAIEWPIAASRVDERPIAARSDAVPTPTPKKSWPLFAGLAAMFLLFGGLFLGFGPAGLRDQYAALVTLADRSLNATLAAGQPPQTSATEETASMSMAPLAGDVDDPAPATGAEINPDTAPGNRSKSKSDVTGEVDPLKGALLADTATQVQVKAEALLVAPLAAKDRPVFDAGTSESGPALKPAAATATDTTPRSSEPFEEGALPEAAKDNLIIRIQTRLEAMGLDPGPLDGLMGPKTRTAIEDYQSEYGLAADGQPTEALLAHLEDFSSEDSPPAARELKPKLARTSKIESGTKVAPSSAASRLEGKDRVTVQLSSLKTAEDAIRMKSLLQTKFSHLFKDGTLEVRAINDNQTGVLYRVYIAGSLDRNRAQNICAELWLDKQTCLLVEN